METIKISVDINVDFSENAKAFLTSLFSQQVNTGKSTKQEKPAAPAKAEKPAAPAKAEKPAKTQKPVNTQATPAAQAEDKASPELIFSASTPKYIKIDVLRTALKEKVNDHRAAIKEKLGELGATSITSLDFSKYEEMYNFLTQL